MELEIASQPERIAAKHNPATQLQIEVAERIDIATRMQRRDTEEIKIGVDLEAPEIIADHNFHAGIEFQNAQDFDVAVDIKNKSRINPIASNAGGVQLQQ